MKTLLVGVASLVLAASTAAQSTAFGGQLVGYTGPGGPVISIIGYLYSQDIGSCPTPVRRGTSMRMTKNGGAAYDAARQAVWLSNGKTIVLKNIGSGQEACTFAPTMNGAAGTAVTGLAHSNRNRELIQLEVFPTSNGSSLMLRFYDTSACPPVLLRKACTIALATGATAGGVAYDEVRDLILFSTSITSATGTMNTIHHITSPLLCLVPTTQFTLPSFRPCGGTTTRGVSGLAYDSCSQILYSTEGTVTLLMDLSNLSSPVNLNASKPCCKFAVPRQTWAGLAYVPKSSNSSVGVSCLPASCGTCANMKFEVVGDLVLGNQNMSLQISNAPPGGTASLYISLGQCGWPGLQLPGLCGAIHPTIAAGQPILLGSFTLGTGGACAGGTILPAPVPNDLSLCNVGLCAQFFIACPSSQGAGLTNAVEFKVGG